MGSKRKHVQPEPLTKCEAVDPSANPCPQKRMRFTQPSQVGKKHPTNEGKDEKAVAKKRKLDTSDNSKAPQENRNQERKRKWSSEPEGTTEQTGKKRFKDLSEPKLNNKRKRQSIISDESSIDGEETAVQPPQQRLRGDPTPVAEYDDHNYWKLPPPAIEEDAYEEL